MMQNQNGYSLIELLVSIAVGSIVLSLVAGFLFAQQRISVTQNAVVDMQEGIRSAVSLMTREIRMAGFDPEGRRAGAGIEQADVDSFTFTTDDNGNGKLLSDTTDPTSWEPNERIRYKINTSGNLGRATGKGNLQPLAFNVDALNFVYLDENGNRLDDDGDGNVTDSIENIRSVQITVVARSGETLPALFLRAVDSMVYQNLQGETVFTPSSDDGFRRIIINSTAMLRNMGLPDPQ
jgi:type IV pilus assembly protein PilW